MDKSWNGPGGTPQLATPPDSDASETLDPKEGRELYGQDPAGYERGRPDYPPEVYRILRDHCGLGQGSVVLEIGPGSGLATRHLLEAGAAVTAVEPSQAMATHLRLSMADEASLQVIATPFEEVALPEDCFDMVVAATSFHWVRPRAHGRLTRLLRPGGRAAIWWTIWNDPDEPDEFDRAMELLLREPSGPSPVHSGSYQLDVEARRADLQLAGLEQARAHIIRTIVTLDALQMRDLWATTAVVLRRDAQGRRAVLDSIKRLVEQSFDGAVTRTFVTAMYTATNHRATS
jgi:SAM-dependent methyltransferase